MGGTQEEAAIRAKKRLDRIEFKAANAVIFIAK